MRPKLCVHAPLRARVLVWEEGGREHSPREDETTPNRERATFRSRGRWRFELLRLMERPTSSRRWIRKEEELIGEREGEGRSRLGEGTRSKSWGEKLETARNE